MLHHLVCWYVKCVEKVPFRKSGHNYCLVVAELCKRFTPVRLPAIQSSLFHDRR